MASESNLRRGKDGRQPAEAPGRASPRKARNGSEGFGVPYAGDDRVGCDPEELMPMANWEFSALEGRVLMSGSGLEHVSDTFPLGPKSLNVNAVVVGSRIVYAPPGEYKWGYYWDPVGPLSTDV